MTRNRANFLSYLFIVAVVAIAAYLYPRLPDPMPIHWNLHGQPDAFVTKPWGVVAFPAIPILMFVIMRLMPVISPKGFRIEPFRSVFNIFQVAMIGFVSFVSILALFQAYGIDVRLNQVIFATLGILFMIIGNYLGKVRKNFFLGIRTPWTLASDEVWSRTHRLGGWLLILIGLILFSGAFFTATPGWLVLLVILAALVPTIYSYFIYRRVEGFERDEDDAGGA